MLIGDVSTNVPASVMRAATTPVWFSHAATKLPPSNAACTSTACSASELEIEIPLGSRTFPASSSREPNTSPFPSVQTTSQRLPSQTTARGVSPDALATTIGFESSTCPEPEIRVATVIGSGPLVTIGQATNHPLPSEPTAAVPQS